MYQRAVSTENMNYIPAGIPIQAEPASEVRTGGSVSSRGALSELGELLSKLKLSSLDTGDILMAAILYFTLHDSGDDDLFWITVVLFLIGRDNGTQKH